MTYPEAKAYFIEHLTGHFDGSEIEELSKRCLHFWSGKTSLQLHFDGYVFDDALLTKTVSELQCQKPIQYILGFEYFGPLELKVTPDVLIPRPETEELCRWILDEISPDKTCRIVDLGTGSGCIPIYLGFHRSDITLFAVDYSAAALAVARSNAQRYASHIQFIEANMLLDGFEWMPPVDVMVSNPPYILQEEKASLSQRVVDFEPHLALFVQNEDALQFYKRIAELSNTLLKPQGRIYMEVHQHYARETETLFQQKGFNTDLRHDVYGNPRMLKAWK